MFGIKMFVSGTFVGMCAGLFVANFHVINTSQGVVVVPRTQRPPLRSSYVDIRSWSNAMWTGHPEVTQALIADGRSSLIQENLKDNLLKEILPQQTLNAPASLSRNIASQTDVPIQIETLGAGNGNSATQPPTVATSSTRLLDSQSPVRKQLESVFDQAIAPIVEDDPADSTSAAVASTPPSTNDASSEAMIQQIEAKLGGMLGDSSSTSPTSISPQLKTLPTSGDAHQMARDLLQQVIPPTGTLPASAAPLRDFGRDLLNAPAPGQGAASQAIPKPPAQSQLILSEPF